MLTQVYNGSAERVKKLVEGLHEEVVQVFDFGKSPREALHIKRLVSEMPVSEAAFLLAHGSARMVPTVSEVANCGAGLELR